MKYKRSQLTIFIAVGLVLVFAAVFMYSLSRQRPDSGPGTIIGAQNTQDSLTLLTETCLELATFDAVMEFGFDQAISTPLIEEYIESHLPSCFEDFTFYREQGFDVNTGDIAVDATITSEALTVDLDYPITLSGGDSIVSVEGTSYQFPRKYLSTINPNAETVVTTKDRRTLLIIPAGTEASLNDQPLERVGIDILDREFNGNSNSVLAGMMAFAGIPHGAVFSKPVTLIHFYDQRDVPSTISEVDVRLGFYSNELGSWVGMPTTVDADNNILTATTTHFSPYGAVLRCTAEEDITEFHATPVVKEDCAPCADWKTGSAPSGVGELWIESDGITTGHGIGLDTEGYELEVCDGPTKVTTQVSSCSNCDGDCKGELPGPPAKCLESPSTGELGVCDCEFTYYSYESAEFKGYAMVEVEFADGGDSCIWTEEDRDPSIAKKDSDGESADYDDADIQIDTVCPEEKGDTCHITQWLFENSKLSFLETATNALEPADACLEAGVTVKFSGFGIQSEGSYYACETDGDEADMPGIGGGINDIAASVCVCEDLDSDGEDNVCKWTLKPEEISGGGAVTDHYVNEGSDGGGGAEERREKDKCPEGDKEPQEYPTCPEDFEEKYLHKNFTFNPEMKQDTRTEKFCDKYGDIPEMQYADWSLDDDTAYYIMGSVMRKDRCWFLVEAQKRIDDNLGKPDFYFEFEDANNWLAQGEDWTFEDRCARPEESACIPRTECEERGSVKFEGKHWGESTNGNAWCTEKATEVTVCCFPMGLA